MKKSLFILVAFICIIDQSYSQTLYVPSGTSGIGSSTNGNVGIGTSSNPSQKLEVSGNILSELDGIPNIIANGYENTNAQSRPTFQMTRARGTKGAKLAVRENDHLGAFFFGGCDGSSNQFGGAVYGIVDGTVSAGSVPLRISFVTGSNSTNRLERLIIKSNGNVLIGKTTQVNSTYKLDVAGKIRADEIVINSNGADFVFSPNYQLPNLFDIEQFVKTNKHLPEIPSATEMQQEGVSVSDMQTKLLQKVEELTLYMIELKKENEQLKSEVEKIKNR